MKVILLEDVKNIGRKHDVKEVSYGYARNFLFPRRMAEAATPDALKRLEAARAKWVREDAEATKHLTALARLLADRKLVFSLKVNTEGKIFGSVTKDAIQKALRDADLVRKDRVEVELPHPLKELGEHKVLLYLKKGITAELTVVLQRQE